MIALGRSSEVHIRGRCSRIDEQIALRFLMDTDLRALYLRYDATVPAIKRPMKDISPYIQPRTLNYCTVRYISRRQDFVPIKEYGSTFAMVI